MFPISPPPKTAICVPFGASSRSMTASQRETMPTNSASVSETEGGSAERFASSVTAKSRRYPSRSVPAACRSLQFSPRPAQQASHFPQGTVS